MLVSERLRISSEIKILSEVDEVVLSGGANPVNSGLAITAGNAQCGGVSERWHYWLQKSHWLKTPHTRQCIWNSLHNTGNIADPAVELLNA